MGRRNCTRKGFRLGAGLDTLSKENEVGEAVRSSPLSAWQGVWNFIP